MIKHTSSVGQCTAP